MSNPIDKIGLRMETIGPTIKKGLNLSSGYLDMIYDRILQSGLIYEADPTFFKKVCIAVSDSHRI